jgi:ABC-type uncharacterized transport system permease subunit
MILASATSTSPYLAALAVAAVLAYGVSAIGGVRGDLRSARLAGWVAWLMHGVLLIWSLAGDVPRFGFAPALSVTAWLVATIYGIEGRLFPRFQIRSPLPALGALAVVLSVLFPGNPLHPNASAWLPLHWALGIASYSLFGAAVAHAAFMTRAERKIRQASDAHAGMPLLMLERLTFRFVSAGFILLTATLLAGFIFEGQLYSGTSMRKWDHKTAFSLLAWLTFAVLLLGRARFGWRGRRALRVLYLGSGFLLLAYVGSRFVMEIILGRTA